MSDYLPFEIQVEILKRLPVKLLIQLRSVSKAWKSLIDSSPFIARYSVQHTQMKYLLVSYEDSVDCEQKYVSVVDDHTFPQQKVPLTIPLFAKMLMCYSIIGSSHGLFCFYGDYPKFRGGAISKTKMAVIWNISIRKAVAFVVPNVEYGIYGTVYGFGVCRETIDPKIVKIIYINRMEDIESISCIPWHVEVFTLSTGAWRMPHSSNLPRKSIEFTGLHVVIDGVLYWLTTDRIIMDGGFRSYNLIVSFNMTSEEFKEVNLPDCLAHQFHYNLSISKLKKSLVVLECNVESNNPVSIVWMMEDGVPNSFTKLFTVNVYVNTPDAFMVRGFRKSGKPIIEILEDDLAIYKLVVYESYTKHMDDLGIDIIEYSTSIYPYKETLLLLDQPNFTVYDEMGTLKFLDDLVL